MRLSQREKYCPTTGLNSTMVVLDKSAHGKRHGADGYCTTDIPRTGRHGSAVRAH